MSKELKEEGVIPSDAFREISAASEFKTPYDLFRFMVDLVEAKPISITTDEEKVELRYSHKGYIEYLCARFLSIGSMIKIISVGQERKKND